MHLTDLAAVTPPAGAGAGLGADRRGDDARPGPTIQFPRPDAADSGEETRTLATAGRLTGIADGALRADDAANIRGGAALLASYQRALATPVGSNTDPGSWYGAVARYSGAPEAEAAKAFADEVFDILATGAVETTEDNQEVLLTAGAAQPDTATFDRLGLPWKHKGDGTECPARLSCERVQAPYQLLGDGSDLGNYGNYDKGVRPDQQKIDYIVIHDTEIGYDGTLGIVTNPGSWASWHYTIRSMDGHVAQHVKATDVAWHANNWSLNAKSIGIEHEGYAATGTWYTEALYRSSAKLVRHLAARYDVPLDRAHVIGHDNVPAPKPSKISDMHWDPGPYWNWSHYFDLLRAPLPRTGPSDGGVVTIQANLWFNKPVFTGCDDAGSGNPCPVQGSSDVVLRTEPRGDAPLVSDLGLRPDGTASTMDIADYGPRASTGQRYAIADRCGDWTAIWYLGQKAWFHNPGSHPNAVATRGQVVTLKPGRESASIYGWPGPEITAYPEGVTPAALVALPYQLTPGQRYSYAGTVRSESYQALTFDGSTPGDWTVVRGDTRYAQIQFGRRLMYVDVNDVQILPV
jgi:hypothetical protein